MDEWGGGGGGGEDYELKEICEFSIFNEELGV